LLVLSKIHWTICSKDHQVSRQSLSRLATFWSRTKVWVRDAEMFQSFFGHNSTADLLQVKSKLFFNGPSVAPLHFGQGLGGSNAKIVIWL